MKANQGKRARLFHIGFLVLASAFLYLSLFRFPFTPIYTGYDENLFLFNATRMIDGQLIYRDFFAFVAPGLTLVDFMLFKILGIRAWISDVSLIFVGLGLISLIVVISRRVLSGVAVFLPAVLFLTCAYGFQLDNTEHWYSTLAELGAIAVVIDSRTFRRLLAAGALCGLASFFMQTQGVFAVTGLSLFLLWDGRKAEQKWLEILKRLGCLFVSFTAMILAANAYFIWTSGLHRFLYCTLEFPVKYYSADRDWNSFYSVVFEFRQLMNGDGLPSLGQFIFIHALLPLVYIWFWVRSRREALTHAQRAPLMLLSILGFLQFAGLAPAPTTFRLSAAAAPGLILLVWLLRDMRKLARISTVVLWGVAAVVAIFIPFEAQVQPMRSLDLPRGRMAVGPAYYDNLLWWSQKTLPR